ncbi:hypothetical protein DERP_011023 [Dermatophagoides pteronyssinus]|uniref:Uncharacterized protein n=1 Tax=Dermatophagoides pteronyssinus TaxID=6956 RepID=A0ABQ8JV00_DERPT|nr:hypothetical protein DERP_011023 [Dermatophagoides pteronyssinus]
MENLELFKWIKDYPKNLDLFREVEQCKTMEKQIVMDLTNIRRQIQIVYARVSSRTVTASDGTSVMELANKMVDLEKAGELKTVLLFL